MELSKQAIQEFREIYKDEFDQIISTTEAKKLGINLLNLMNVVYRSAPVVQDGKIKKNGKQR